MKKKERGAHNTGERVQTRAQRRIYVIEVDQRPMECHFKRRNAEVAMATYRLRSAMPPEIVPYAPLLPARRKKRT